MLPFLGRHQSTARSREASDAELSELGIASAATPPEHSIPLFPASAFGSRID